MTNQIFLLLFCIIYSTASNDLLDFRFVSYNGKWKFFDEISQYRFFDRIVESLENLQIYENEDEAFDAIVIDERNDQMIIGAK